VGEEEGGLTERCNHKFLRTSNSARRRKAVNVEGLRERLQDHLSVPNRNIVVINELTGLQLSYAFPEASMS